jgi:hypothetical protein
VTRGHKAIGLLSCMVISAGEGSLAAEETVLLIGNYLNDKKPVSIIGNRLFYCALTTGKEVGNSISPTEREKMLYVFGRLF